MVATERQMIELNKRQADFYDGIQNAEAEVGHGGYAHNPDANLATRFWAKLRYMQQEAVESTGIRARVRQTHLEWIGEKAGGNFLEIGCFSGSDYTFDLIASADAYTGIELSPKACESLRHKISDLGASAKAKVLCGDFLEFDPGHKFDFVYAHGVLHHFENPAPLFARLRNLIADNGLLVFVEPVAINPVFRLLRAGYRPFQSDAAWEWPFTFRTVSELSKHFVVADGFGWGRYSAPGSLLCFLPGVSPVYRWLARKEIANIYNARAFWHSSMILAKCFPL